MKPKALPLNVGNLVDINCEYRVSHEYDVEITVGISSIPSDNKWDDYECYGYAENIHSQFYSSFGSIEPLYINGYKWNMFQSMYNLMDLGGELNIANDYLAMNYKYLDVTIQNPEVPSEHFEYRLENGWIDDIWSYNDRCLSFWYNDGGTAKNFFTGKTYESHKIPSNKSHCHIVGIPLGFKCVVTEMNPPYGTIISTTPTHCKWYLDSASSFTTEAEGKLVMTNLVDKRNGGPGYIEFDLANSKSSSYTSIFKITIDGHTYHSYYPLKY